jgi:hypothetical protein
MSKVIQIRLFYFIAILFAAFLGIGSRLIHESLPNFLSAYTGDTMWAIGAYFLMRILFVKITVFQNGIAAFLISLFIEFSQFYNDEWINQIRETQIGGYALGFGFMYSDLICYAVGVLIAMGIDHVLFQNIRGAISEG